MSWLALSGLVALSAGQTVTIDTSQRFQTIDGFGTCLSSDEPDAGWWQSLYFDDLQASMLRVDLTPPFAAPYSNETYCSPWYGNAPPLAMAGDGGPDGTWTRPYTGPSDYSAAFGGCSAPIAVMGPDIDANAAKMDFKQKGNFGLVAQLGQSKAAALGGFKLYGSLWSPAPWVKQSSGNTYGGGAFPLPAAGTPWPFIWGGNFAGGTLDISGTPLSVFTDDGGVETSSLTQWARGLSAFLHGFQNTYGVRFYAVSIQNELNFEEFYNSATYPLAAQYLAALGAARAELDSHADLAAIKIMGPEDLMGGDAYSLWQYGSGATEVDKNLHYLAAIAAADAGAALGGFAIHGYAPDGISSAGVNPQQWSYWVNGWQASPAGGIPANVAGFAAFGKPSWMTETSGEDVEWLASSSGAGGFPDNGAFSVALKILQALTTGQQSAWLYWQLTDGSPSTDSDVQTLTDSTQQATAPKYVAAKHFFRTIRPGAQRVAATVPDGGTLLAGAFVLDSAQSLTIVLINEAAGAATVTLDLPSTPAVTSFDAYTSSSGSYWVESAVSVAAGSATVSVPGYGVVTLVGAAASAGDGGVASSTGTGGSSTGSASGGATSGATGSSTGSSTGGGSTTTGGAGTGGATGSSTSGATGSGATGGTTGTGTPPTRIESGCSCSSASGLELALLPVAALWLRRRKRAPASLDAGF